MSDAILPDRGMMSQCLEAAYGQALHGHPALAFNRPGTKDWPRVPFDLANMEDAVELAYERNLAGENVYFCPALIKEPKSAVADADFLVVWAVVVDLDEPGAPLAAAKVCRVLGCLPTFATVTGRYAGDNGEIKDHLRQQLIWVLTEGCDDSVRYRALQRAMCAALGGDMSATNPTRLFRLGGSIALPTKPGRIEEQTEIYPVEGGRPYDIEELERLFPAEPAPVTAATPTEGDKVDFVKGLYTGALNADSLLQAIGRPHQWHDSVLRWVGRLSQLGLSDNEIRMMAPAITTDATNPQTRRPYTVHDSLDALEPMIRGARAKWGVQPDNTTGLVDSPDDVVPTDLINIKEVMPAWPAELSPSLLGQYVESMAEQVGCPVDFCGVASLASLATAIGKGWQVEILPTWHERICMWAAIVAHSGSAKTPAINHALGPIYKIQKENAERHAERKASYDKEYEQFLLDMQVFKKAYKAGDAVMADAPKEPEAPGPEPRLMLSDATQERAAAMMAEQEHGFILVRDELAGWFGDLNKYRVGGDREFWLSTWSFQPHYHDRRASGASFKVDVTYTNILGGIQPGVLGKAMLDGPVDGMTARFGAMIYPARREVSGAIPPPIDDELLRVFRHVHERLYKMRPDDLLKRDDDKGAYALALAPDALEVFMAARGRWMTEAQRLGEAGNEAVGAHMAKYPGFLARLAGLLHMARLALAADDLSMAPAIRSVIDRRTVEVCRDAIDGYFWPHANHIYRLFGSTDTQNLVRRVALSIRSGVFGNTISMAAIRKRNWAGLQNRKSIVGVLDELEAAGWLFEIERPAGIRGGRSTLYLVNEKIYQIPLPEDEKQEDY